MCYCPDCGSKEAEIRIDEDRLWGYLITCGNCGLEVSFYKYLTQVFAAHFKKLTLKDEDGIISYHDGDECEFRFFLQDKAITLIARSEYYWSAVYIFTKLSTLPKDFTIEIAINGIHPIQNFVGCPMCGANTSTFQNGENVFTCSCGKFSINPISFVSSVVLREAFTTSDMSVFASEGNATFQYTSDCKRQYGLLFRYRQGRCYLLIYTMGTPYQSIAPDLSQLLPKFVSLVEAKP